MTIHQCETIHIASAKGHIECLKQFLVLDNLGLNKTCEPGDGPLHIASMEGHLEVIKLLLDNGAEINKPTDYGVTALDHSCYFNDYDCVQLLLDRGADPNLFDDDNLTDPSLWGPLHNAVYSGNQNIIQLLLDRGAQINKKHIRGHIPLYYAILNDKLDCVKLLLDNGADLYDLDFEGKTPFDIASPLMKEEIIKYLHCDLKEPVE